MQLPAPSQKRWSKLELEQFADFGNENFGSYFGNFGSYFERNFRSYFGNFRSYFGNFGNGNFGSGNFGNRLRNFGKIGNGRLWWLSSLSGNN
jgi:hypothetical protein